MIAYLVYNAPMRMIMSNVARWIVSTSLLTGLMVGVALILFLLASALSEFLNQRYHLDDDWSLLVLPVGALVGLVLGVRYRKRGWLRCLAGALLVLSIGLIVSWSIPRQAPEGMNGLPIALGNILRAALRRLALITCGLSLAVAAVTNSILSLIPKRKAEN